MYHLTLTENQARIRALLQQLSKARCDPRRWVRLDDVEPVLQRTHDPESFRSFLLISTHLEDVIESDREINYPLWSAMRLPYIITNGPGRKCTAAELVDAPIWNSELNWMDVLGHLGRMIPAVRECAVGSSPNKLERVNARLTTELAPLLFEMNTVAPVLIGEVEKLLQPGAQAETAADKKLSAQQEISQVQIEVEKSRTSRSITNKKANKKTNEKTAAATGSDAQRKKSIAVKSNPAKKKTKVAAKTKNPKQTPAKVAANAKKAVAASNAVKTSQSKAKSEKTATAESERRALAVSIADSDAANDQYAYQLVLPLFA